mmetsp:Transcript_22743/g.59236  ORF Transcript_22743/g.59236 Transcript_22743/m.59236 type:complete len:260 (-) Transcript_22743:777-1556(-)
MGSQSKSDALTNIIPARDTVAGDAFRRSSTSNMSLTLSVIGMRSPFANVRILLSSKTVLRFSIQTASTGPSQRIHVLSLRARSLNFPHMAAKIPLIHSPDRRSVSPNISSARMAFGFILTRLCCIPKTLLRTSCNTFIMFDLPAPGGPTNMIPWRTNVVSYSWITFNLQLSWSINLYLSITVVSVSCTFSWPPPCGMVIAGNKSASNERNKGTSCATNFERFMSLRVRMTSNSSSASSSLRFVAPAVRNTDRILRRPKS